MFGSLGFSEVMMILIIGLIIFGPKKLPEIGRSLGNAIREFRRASNDIMNTLSLENEYSSTTRRSYSDYSSYSEPTSYTEQTVSQSDIVADDVNVAPSPEEPYSNVYGESDTETASGASSDKVRSSHRRVLVTPRPFVAHRNTRRRV
jgi:TatA/E family protein of Tat protein translocase